MARKTTLKKNDFVGQKLPKERVSLKILADYVGLAPATVSLVMNRSAVADSIPKETQERIFEAARKLNYRPNFFARSLRSQRSFTIGVMVPEVSEGYAALVMSGIEDHLLNEGYFYFVASHRHRPDLIDEYPKLLLSRSVDGLIAVDTPWQQDFPLPVVTILLRPAFVGRERLGEGHHTLRPRRGDRDCRRHEDGADEALRMVCGQEQSLVGAAAVDDEEDAVQAELVE